ncbi:PfkB family carbohydrate kinase [Syntrophomonas erecta]
MRLTAREKELFDLLKNEPLMSQEELAAHLGITRSSVAVHISNLMKKGVILGKGYVLNEQVTIVIIGEFFLSIYVHGQEKQCIDVSYCGDTYELAKAFAKFGVNVKVISVIGNDEIGTDILNCLQEMGVDTSSIVRATNRRTCRRVVLEEGSCYEEGFALKDFEKAISSMEWVAFNCEYLVVEPCFQSAVVNKSLNKDEDKLPYFCTYLYLEELDKIPEDIERFSVFVLGWEAAHYGWETVTHQIQSKIKMDNQLGIITDGKSRLLYVDQNGINDFPLLPNQIFDCSKGLPLLLAGIVYGLSCGYPVRQAIRIGVGTASIID